MSSPILRWMLIKKHNCFMTRRGGVTFTSEPGNLTNKHSFKNSGLANDNVVDFKLPKRQRKVKIVTKVSKNMKSPKSTWSSSDLNVGGKKNVKTIIKALNDAGRDDLRRAALAKYSALSRLHKIRTKKWSAGKVKKGRQSRRRRK